MLQSFDGSCSASVQPRIDPVSGKPFDLAYNIVVLDPASGAVLDRVQFGAISQGWQNLMGFIYELHWTLALGSFGMWTLGICALAWTIDNFVGFYLTLPSRRRTRPDTGSSPARTWWQRWKPAWKDAHGQAATSSTSTCTAPVACGFGRCC